MKIQSPGGNLFSLAPIGFPLYSITKFGQVWSHRRKRFLVPKIHRCNYLFLRLQTEDGLWKNRYLHRLVALMFIPTGDVTMQIDHINGDKQNNDWRNLRWVTNRQNAHFAMQHGLMPHAVFMTDETAHTICRMLSDGMSVMKISRKTGFSDHAIYAIRYRRNWTHVSDQYDFGNRRKRSVMSDKDAHRICQLILLGETDASISRETSIPASLIGRIRNGMNFKRISKQYFTVTDGKRMPILGVIPEAEIKSSAATAKVV